MFLLWNLSHQILIRQQDIFHSWYLLLLVSLEATISDTFIQWRV